MLRIPFLRNLLLLVLVMVACMPLYALLILHPAYHEQLVHETEDESTRFATYLVKGLHLEGVRLERESLPVVLEEQVKIIKDGSHLIKLRIFSPDGEIIFSSDKTEIGKANSNDYFRNIVAKGKVFSKIAEKDHKTAEGVITKVDIVETYVPFMAAGRFGGAIEVYYDITSRVAKFNALTMRTTTILVFISLGFLVLMGFALNKAQVSLEERGRAEEALRQVNDELETRVAERTTELSEANAQLTTEIAERTLAQMALSQALEDSRRDREKLDGILSSVGDGLIVTDRQLTVLQMNAAAEKLLGVSFEKALGQSLDRLAGTTGLPDRIHSLLVGTCSTSSFDFELPGEDPKHPRVYQTRISRLESDAEQAGAVLLIQDVTRERELDRMKNAFLGMAAHELNTPLAAILGFSELLAFADSEHPVTPEQQDEYTKLIHNKALELSRLVDDLLDISRVEAGQPLILDYESVRLDEMLREVIRPYQEKSPRHRFELHFTTAQTEIAGDKGRIRQVFNNLISNAVKYSPQGGLIRVTLGNENGCCRLSVSDQGIGMTAEQVAHMFDKFYRADSSNTAVHGVGLGMSIVRHIVEAHQGDIRVESQPGVGTAIHVDLPLTPSA
ncbi:MAG: cell wall metabolism sensor histidine kinase WalK [Desulfuromonadales bacterium]|nr:cell wall metabolism sensor histidine kinase WalK [Desulfuromonadales bacterium]